jgi:RND family efflux transporter MFP subunit
MNSLTGKPVRDGPLHRWLTRVGAAGPARRDVRRVDLPGRLPSPCWGRRLLRAATLATFAISLGTACKRAEPAPPPRPDVLVTDVVQRDVPIYHEWVGTTVGFVNAQVMPHVQGYLLKQDHQDGAFVKAGQLLFEIDDRTYKAALDQALGDLAQQGAALRKNQQDVAKFTPLSAQGAVSKKELDDAVQATSASEAQVKAAEAAVENARLNLGWCKIYSPIEGIAGIAPVQVGDLVNTSTVLTTVSQVDPMKVTFPITEREYLRYADRIKEHQEKGRAPDEPELQLILADGSAYPRPGRFYVANRQIDQQTGTILVQTLFPNPDAILRPGLYAKVRAPTETRHGAVLVPQRAVQETQGVYQVAVVGSGEKVALRTVKAGAQVDGFWIIEGGLGPDERVVTQGLQKVKDGIVVRAKADTSVPAAPAPPGRE